MNNGEFRSAIYHQPAHKYIDYIALHVRRCITSDLRNLNNEEAWRTYGMVTTELSKVPGSLEAEFDHVINDHTAD